jgi:type I restriction-modification system DNA methylase subunit
VIEIPKGGSFADMVKLKGDREIGEKVNKIISKLAEANDLKGVIDVADFNDEHTHSPTAEFVDDVIVRNALADERPGLRHLASILGCALGQVNEPKQLTGLIDDEKIGRPLTLSRSTMHP